MLSATSLSDGPSEGLIWLGVIVVFVAFLFISFIMLLTRRYKRCPSNKVLVVFGKVARGESAHCIHGGAAFIWPLIQNYSYLSLEPMQIEIPLKGALSIENIRVNVPSVFTVAVGTQAEVMQNAAIRLLGLTSNEIKQQAQDIIFGQLRQVIASMQIEDINRDRDAFLLSIQSSLEPELRKIGLVLINVNITDITDESGYIEAIGRKAASQAVQQARGDVADQEKMGEVRVAEAEREMAIRVAEAHKVKSIGTREAQRDQAVRIAELEKEQKVGEQTAAFERDAQVKESEREQAVRIAELDKEQRVGEQTATFQREAQVKDADRAKRVDVAEAEAAAITGENESQGKIAASNADLQVKRAEAYQLGETKKRESDAAVLEAQNLAMAKAAVAEAERVEAEKRADLEATAKAEKARTVVEAEAEAQKRRIEAEGAAAAVFAQLDAEARGQYEIMAKKGQGLQEIISACGSAQEAFQMLMLEHLDTLAETSAKAISNVKFDKIIVWEGGNQDGSSNTASFLHNMSHYLPPMLQVMKDVGGVELPETLVKLGGGVDDSPGQSAVADASPTEREDASDKEPKT